MKTRATDATHSKIKTQMERRRQQSREKNEVYRHKEHRDGLTTQKMKEEQNPYRAHLYRRKKTN